MRLILISLITSILIDFLFRCVEPQFLKKNVVSSFSTYFTIPQKAEVYNYICMWQSHFMGP